MVFAQIKVKALENANAGVVVREIKVACVQAIFIDNSPVTTVRILRRAIRGYKPVGYGKISLEPPIRILALRNRPDALGKEGTGALSFSAVQEDVVGIFVVQVETFAGLRAAYVLRYGLCNIPGKISLGKVQTCSPYISSLARESRRRIRICDS